MRAVNLMPETRRTGVGSPSALLNPAYGSIALLVVALVMVIVYVLSANSVASRKVRLASLQQQVQVAQAQANQLDKYVAYQKLAQQRVSTIEQIVGGRFDWHAALANLAQVVPANVAFPSLRATAAPGSGSAGSAGAGTGGLRADIDGPAFEIAGCTDNHDDVARLLSRLRVLPGVQRVTLADSVRGGQASASTDQTPTACGPDPAYFGLVVFYTPLPGSSSTATTSGAQPVSSPGGAASAASSATSTTSSTTTTTSTATAAPVSSGSTG